MRYFIMMLFLVYCLNSTELDIDVGVGSQFSNYNFGSTKFGIDLEPCSCSEYQIDNNRFAISIFSSLVLNESHKLDVIFNLPQNFNQERISPGPVLYKPDGSIEQGSTKYFKNVFSINAAFGYSFNFWNGFNASVGTRVNYFQNKILKLQVISSDNTEFSFYQDEELPNNAEIIDNGKALRLDDLGTTIQMSYYFGIGYDYAFSDLVLSAKYQYDAFASDDIEIVNINSSHNLLVGLAFRFNILPEWNY